MDKIFIGELLGTLVLILFGAGTCAANSLVKSYARNAGWVFIVFGWGLGVFAGIIVSNPLSGAHLNPAVSLAFFMQGSIIFSEFAVYVVAQLIGAFLGAGLIYQLYFNHFHIEKQAGLGGIFFTEPAIKDTKRNLLSEMVGTFMLVLFIMMLAHDSTAGSLYVPFVVVGIGIALGSLTGYAINPARDLGPRLLYSLTKLNKNKSANWGYAWIPVLGPLLGGALASAMYTMLVNYLK